MSTDIYSATISVIETDHDPKLFLASRLKLLRKRKGITQADLATMLGVTKTQICDLEKGKTATSIERLYKLANFFDVPIDYLIGKGIFKNWEKIIQNLSVIQSWFQETFPMLQDSFSLEQLSENQLMYFLPAFVLNVDFIDDKINIILRI